MPERFRTGATEPRALGAALAYVCGHRGLTAAWSYDGHGVAVPPSAIVSIEFDPAGWAGAAASAE